MKASQLMNQEIVANTNMTDETTRFVAGKREEGRGMRVLQLVLILAFSACGGETVGGTGDGTTARGGGTTANGDASSSNASGSVGTGYSSSFGMAASAFPLSLIAAHSRFPQAAAYSAGASGIVHSHCPRTARQTHASYLNAHRGSLRMLHASRPTTCASHARATERHILGSAEKGFRAGLSMEFPNNAVLETHEWRAL
jgi:hypothetical protein